MGQERRNFKTELKIERRKDGTAVVEGHAAVFNQMSENLGGFREIIHEGAFDSVLDDDVRALFNHDSNLILGRTPMTMNLSVDSRGLVFKYESPDTTYARDLLVSLERGDISQSSFGFNIAAVDGAEWVEDEETGALTRHIKKISRLFDVSPVTFPAYPQTDVAKRSLDKWKEEHKKESEGTSLVDIQLIINKNQLEL
jgi:HK97 family phage prohead protease